jgi:hypothetical protein
VLYCKVLDKDPQHSVALHLLGVVAVQNALGRALAEI